MTEYILRLSQGHLLFTDDNGSCVLVDTGSPLSFHSSGEISIGGDTAFVPKSLLNVNADYITDNVGVRVEGLLGMDIIGRLGLLIDVPGGRLVFGYPTSGMRLLPSSVFMGYLLVDMTIRGEVVKVFLDTGAPVSYVSPYLTEDLTPIDTITDFNPLMPSDTFETPIFEFQASFDEEVFTMKAGNLPTLMQTMISILGVKGVVGMEIFKRKRVLVADGGVWVE